MRAGKRHEVADCGQLQRNGGRHGQYNRGDARNWQQVALGIIRQLVVLVGMHRECSGERPQQGVVVVRAREGSDCHETVASRTVFDEHRLAPPRGQPVREQARCDIGPRCRAEWHDEPHGPRRIVLPRRASDTQHIREQRDQERKPRHHDAPCLGWAATE